MAMNTLNTREEDEDCLCTIASSTRWAKLYGSFLSLFRLKGVRRETVERLCCGFAALSFTLHVSRPRVAYGLQEPVSA